MSTYAEYKQALAGLRLPAAYVDLDRFDANVMEVRRRAGSKRIRVASKSIRCVGLLRRVLGSDPAFQGVLCYSPWEAVFLSRKGLDDLLVAYPAWDEDALEAVVEEVARGKILALTIDSIDHVRRIAAVASGHGVSLPVCLDVDMSSSYPGLRFGVWRSPVGGVDQALAVAAEVEAHPSLKLEGVMGYEAQLSGVPDRLAGQPLRGAVVRLLKARSERVVARRRAEVVEALQARGHGLRLVNGGGTGCLESTREEACVTEVTAGSAFFAPALFDGYRRFRHLPAAGFAVEVTRRPAPGIYTCAGGGYVASGAAGRDKLPRPYLPEGARLVRQEGAGEVQTPVRYLGPERVGLGDPVFFRHAKAGELCEHFTELLLLANGMVADEAATYRGEGQCFL
jgi:D-serine deaminase-like pyridoxal phosphate-dependent protein